MTTRPSVSNPTTRWLRACYWKTYSLLALLLVALLAPPPVFGYTVPNTADLLFNVNTDALVGAAGTATGSWTTENPVGSSLTSSGGSPKNDVINGVKWEKNSGIGFDMYRFPGPDAGGAWNNASPIACTGATIVAAIKPLRYADGGNWNSIVDMFYDGFVLAIDNQDGQLGVWVKGTIVWTGVRIPDQQTTVVSVVANATGGFTLYVNGTSAYVNTTSAAMTSLVPGGSGNTAFKKYINLGRNNPDGWPCFNGNIGDVLVYKVALDATARGTLETDLMAKFKAGGSYTSKTITASAGTGTTITPTGAVTLSYEGDKTFTITGQYGFGVNVLVDAVSQGSIASYTFNDVTTDHTIEVVATVLPTRTISGNVAALAGGGATVSVKPTGSSLPAQQTTTDASGNYTLTVPEGAYAVCASQTGYLISADTVCNATGDQTINFTLTAGRMIPQMEQLLFAADSNTMGAVGTAGTWPLLYSTYPAISALTNINTPTVTKVRGIKYDLNNRTAPEDGYRLNTSITTAPIPANGATVVTVVKPIRNTTSDGWNSVVDIFRDNLVLGLINGGGNAGKVWISRNGVTFTSTNTIPDGQLTILSLVVQPNGNWKVWASAWNGTLNQFGAASVIFSSTTVSSFTAFVPAQMGPDDWRKFINIGRNNGDGWTSFNGYIGDTFVYKTALSDADRAVLEADINTKTTSIPAYNITASAGANGTISPPGVTAVGETDSLTYTITPAWGYDVADVVVDTASQGAITSYTFNNVLTAHAVSASFVAKPTYAVSGTVTRTSDGSPVAGAKVYVSTTANASASPTYTLTADASGNYSTNLFNATWYLCSSASGLITSADTSVMVAGAAAGGINFSLAASGKNIPQMDQLLFSLYGTALTAAAPTTNPWPYEHPAGLSMVVIGQPQITTVDGVQWEQNRYGTTFDGYRTALLTAAIPTTGITATAVVQPQGDGVNGGNWASVIDVMYSRFILCVRGTDGSIRVCRNGEWQDAPAAFNIPNGQKTVLTAVVQPDGKYKVFANGIQAMDVITTSPMTSLDPTVSTWGATGAGFWSYLSVGRNAPDGWTAYQGNIGSAFLWKTALTQGERIAFETGLGTTYGIAMPVYHNITTSAGTGGTISPSGVVPVLAGADQTFTITPNIGYRILDVVVDDVESLGATSTYTFPAVSGAHKIAATFAVVPQWTITGKVTSNNAAVEGAKVYFSPTPNAKLAPAYTAVTNSDGMYSQVVYEGSLYAAADATNYYTTTDTLLNVTADTSEVNFVLNSSVRNIPRKGDLLFSALTDAFPASGATGDWPTDVPVGGSLIQMGNPTVAIVDGQKWNNNVYPNTGYRFGEFADAIPVNGVTAVAVIRPIRNGIATGWTSVIDVFYNRLVVGVLNSTGQVIAWRNGTLVNSGGYVIPDGQKTVLSLVAQPTGEFKVYANGQTVISNTTTSAMTSLDPLWNGGTTGYWSNINVGRNNPDGWTVFNGNIGDAFLYKVALTSAERKQLETDCAAKFGITLPVLHTITTTVGPNGTINPGGDVEVIEGQDQTFAINAAFGYSVESVTVDGKLEATPATSYTFTNVVADHTLAATFVQLDPYATWVTYYSFLTEEDAAKTADPDGDGQDNLMESALDSDPLSAAASGRVRSQIENVDGENALLITLPVLAGTPGFTGATSKTATFGGVVYTIEGSNDLAAFGQLVTEVTPARAAGMPAFSGTGAWTYRTFRLSGAVPARGATGFLRVRVAAAAP
jgi:hypothetical protein